MKFDAVEVEELVDTQRSEDRQLDFKSYLYRREKKAELAKEVTAFANTAGGTILLGVNEIDGIASAVPGVDPPEGFDKELNWMAATLRSWTSPRVGPAVDFDVITLPGTRHVIAIDIDRSWAGPHAVKAPGQDALAFHHRVGRESPPLDGGQVANLVRESMDLPAQLDAVHADRVGAVEAGELPRPTFVPNYVVFTLMPWSAMRPRPLRFAVSGLRPLLLDRNTRYQPSIEGLVVIDTDQFQEDAPAFQQAVLHRTGMVDYVSGAGFYLHSDKKTLLFSPLNLEERLVRWTCDALGVWRGLGVSAPCSVALTVLGTEDAFVHTQPNSHLNRLRKLRRPAYAIPRLDLEVLPGEETQEVATALRPMFEMIAQMAGWATTKSFSPEGHWDIHRRCG